MQKRSDKVANLLLLIFFTVLIIFPIYIILLNSFKTRGEMLTSILSFPQIWTLENYAETIKKLSFFPRLLNTFFITTIAVIGVVFFSALAGYKIARTDNKLGKIMFVLFTSSMLIPFHSIMISLTQVSQVVGARGSKLGLSFIYIGLGVNLAIFLFHGFTKSIPKELEESAAMDGCNEFQTFWYVVFPLLKPIAATVAIIDCLWIWNDFLLPLLMLNNTKDFTLVLGINQFFGLYNTDWTNILAGLILTSLPIIVFYMFFQKNIVKGIANGAVKG